MTAPVSLPIPGLWGRYMAAMDAVTQRLERIARALNEAGVPFALVGGQAVALWVASKDPAAVRTTKDVDILIRRQDLPAARAAARNAAMTYFESLGVGMFLEKSDPNPRHGVHLVWAAEKVRPENPLPAPAIEQRVEIEPGKPVVHLRDLVAMKLMANRDQDRVHLRDMIDVGLVGPEFKEGMPEELAALLGQLLSEQGK